MKEAADFIPSSDTNWESLDVAYIASGDPEEDRRLAELARAKGQVVFLRDLPEESDVRFNVNSPAAAPIASAPSQTRNNTKIPLTWETIQQKIWAATIRKRTRTEVAVNIFSAIALMIVGHLLFTFFTYDRLTVLWNELELNEGFFYYVLGGFVAQMIDGALGMAYGVTAATFLLTLGVPPSAVSASVHTSEIFTSGVSGYMHLKFGNVNSKLFKKILFPGVLGAITGAYLLSSFEKYIYVIKPLVAVYTLILGILIIQKALKKRVEKKPMTKIGWLAMAGGTLDSIGGGGWGPIVTSTLIARGRHPKYTIGSVNLAEFFVSLASSVTFISIIGFSHWQVVLGLILGGMVAAPIAANLSRRLPIKTMMIMVGTVIIIVSLRIVYMVLSAL
ncbi:sulfite exporter TauE/SafE family protein [Dyadobacter chenwenxiniae]|uniref:Probable membrane transporter protein n=1 Tax=Dyadobacter chenwenxiniae TaxID=2906456 RepID=A0A9X1PRA4_9BACT|nr:TSUP family transporter [Dyadobacter chenwenxiniae]MCF0052203.1 sulfite exporter TauE/SafE family protein [Dyadobacter chenwenxiniae]MCF0063546.1 sulfite exporter TauE/SafE family protein [Dyadobacter chenwenxiniae]UON83224.1 sulfite exporter TauE/SafE family protein [Dyadobacter chenwenxiniae]